MKPVDLKTRPDLWGQYVELRNRHRKNLLTAPVALDETMKWMKEADVEVRALEDSGTLLGVVIVYLDRAGEVAVFAREPRKGAGSALLRLVEATGLWAWVLEDNAPARRLFAKCGYHEDGLEERTFEGVARRGVVFRKRPA